MKKIYSLLFAIVFASAIKAQCPTFSINAPSGNIAGCSPNTVPLNAIDTSGVAGVTYTWVSASTGTIIGNSINGTGPNTYSVFASAPSNTCITTQTVSVFQNTLTPSMTVTPISQTLTCNGACKSFTATSFFSPNIVGNWFNPDMSPMTGLSTSPIIMCANAKGIYTSKFCNVINGCCTSQTVSVTSNTAVPTISVTSVFGFVLNCTRPCLPMSINSSGTLAPTTYTWTNLTTSVSTSPLNGGFTVCTSSANGPGSYQAAFMDGNFCKVTTTINISIDTIKPSPFSSTNLSWNSYTINCFTPSLVATALTNPMYSASNYSWTQPSNLIINSNTVSIAMINIPGSSATYTVSAMGTNGCVGKSKVIFYKDIYVPPYGIVFTPSAITCSNPCIAMSATTTTTVNVTFTFTSPPPTTTATTAGSSFCIPGTYTMTYMNLNNGCIGSATTVVPLNSPCGVNEINFNDNISIAPNPNNGKFTVEINTTIENAEIKIVNAIGQEVYRQNIKQGKNEINVGVLAKGIYHYSIIQNKEPVNRGKILIE